MEDRPQASRHIPTVEEQVEKHIFMMMSSAMAAQNEKKQG
jgi:hypothetical protein